MSYVPMMETVPDIIVHSGKVLNTVDENGSVSFVESEAFAVAGGRVIAIGPNSQILSLAGHRTELINLNGRVVLPGFIETHMHVGHFGANLLQVDCRPTTAGSIDAIKGAVRAAADLVAPGEWIIGWGWDESRMNGAIAPDRFDLDEVAPDNPVKLTRTCGHMALFNSKALESSGVSSKTVDPEGGHLVRDASGRLTGLLQERALELVSTPPQTKEQLRQGMLAAQRELLARGVTTAHDMSTQSRELRTMTEMSFKQLSLRIRPWLWAIDSNGHEGLLEAAVRTGISSGFGNDYVRIQGVKFMLDGSVGGRTAAVEEPFADSSEMGILIRTASEVSAHIAFAIENGLRVAIHGIGERAIDAAIASIAHLDVPKGRLAEMRNRIEHCGLPTHRNLRQMSELGLIAASSVGFLYELGDSYLNNLGPERVARAYPQKSFRAHGIVAPPNSDCPVTDPNPWNVIHAATERRTSSGQNLGDKEAISRAEAIYAYTVLAAQASFEERSLGEISPGAHADFVIIDHDPREHESVLEIRVNQTYIAGKCVYSA